MSAAYRPRENWVRICCCACSPEPFGKRPVVEQFLCFPDGFFHAAREEKFAGPIMVDKAADAVGIRGQHGAAAAHGFRDGIAEAFGVRSREQHAAESPMADK